MEPSPGPVYRALQAAARPRAHPQWRWQRRCPQPALSVPQRCLLVGRQPHAEGTPSCAAERVTSGHIDPRHQRCGAARIGGTVGAVALRHPPVHGGQYFYRYPRHRARSPVRCTTGRCRGGGALRSRVRKARTRPTAASAHRHRAAAPRRIAVRRRPYACATHATKLAESLSSSGMDGSIRTAAQRCRQNAPRTGPPRACATGRPEPWPPRQPIGSNRLPAGRRATRDPHMRKSVLPAHCQHMRSENGGGRPLEGHGGEQPRSELYDQGRPAKECSARHPTHGSQECPFARRTTADLGPTTFCPSTYDAPSTRATCGSLPSCWPRGGTPVSPRRSAPPDQTPSNRLRSVPRAPSYARRW